MILALLGTSVFVLFCLLGKKWEIPLRYVIPWALLLSLGSCTLAWILIGSFPELTNALLFLAGFVFSGSLTAIVLLYFMFRDPERHPPSGQNFILSPADGRVVYVKKILGGEFPFALKRKERIPLSEFTESELITDSGYQIGIGMNLLNVHVNRCPIEGVVTEIKRIRGRFVSLKRIDALLENERVLTTIEGKGIKVGVVQIASRLVRRIICYLDPEDSVVIGQRMGMIRFGSQVDLIIPRENIDILVSKGDEVKAGLSILCRY